MLKPPALLFRQRYNGGGEKKGLDFLKKVDHFGDDVDDGDDVGGDDGSDDTRHLPAGLSGRTFLMKIPITLCC